MFIFDKKLSTFSLSDEFLLKSKHKVLHIMLNAREKRISSLILFSYIFLPMFGKINNSFIMLSFHVFWKGS